MLLGHSQSSPETPTSPAPFGGISVPLPWHSPAPLRHSHPGSHPRAQHQRPPQWDHKQGPMSSAEVLWDLSTEFLWLWPVWLLHVLPREQHQWERHKGPTDGAQTGPFFPSGHGPSHGHRWDRLQGKAGEGTLGYLCNMPRGERRTRGEVEGKQRTPNSLCVLYHLTPSSAKLCLQPREGAACPRGMREWTGNKGWQGWGCEGRDWDHRMAGMRVWRKGTGNKGWQGQKKECQGMLCDHRMASGRMICSLFWTNNWFPPEGLTLDTLVESEPKTDRWLETFSPPISARSVTPELKKTQPTAQTLTPCSRSQTLAVHNEMGTKRQWPPHREGWPSWEERESQCLSLPVLKTLNTHPKRSQLGICLRHWKQLLITAQLYEDYSWGLGKKNWIQD